VQNVTNYSVSLSMMNIFEKCIHHPRKDIVSGNGDKFWICCEKINDNPRCVTNDQYVWNGVVRGHNEFLD